MTLKSLLQIIVITFLVLMIGTGIVLSIVPFETIEASLPSDLYLIQNILALLGNAKNFAILYGICGIGISIPVYLLIFVSWFLRKPNPEKEEDLS